MKHKLKTISIVRYFFLQLNFDICEIECWLKDKHIIRSVENTTVNKTVLIMHAHKLPFMITEDCLNL